MSVRVPFGPHGRDRSPFDDIRHVSEDEHSNVVEWWSARELMAPLGYVEWRNFENAINKAKSACRNSGHQISDHFLVTPTNNVNRGRPGNDVHLTRYACYLVALNGDPDKPEIAAAQRYFVVQTRRAEVELPAMPTSPPAPSLRPWGERLSKSLQEHRLTIIQQYPRGSFSVYTATAMEILMIEDELVRHRMPIHRKDLPDGSIGKRWAVHCQDAGRHQPVGQVPLRMDHIVVAGGQQLVVAVNVYDVDALPFFEEWLHVRYLPEYLPEYFGQKKEWRHLILPAASAADNASLRLTGFPAILKPEERQALREAGGFIPAHKSLSK